MNFKAQFIGLLLSTLFLIGCSEKTPTLTKHKPTPSFELEKLNGGAIQFPTETKGKIVALVFWADWCAFCKTEMRDIEPVYQKYKDKGLVILAINISQDSDTARAFLNDIQISYDVLLDKTGKVTSDYGVTSLPASFVLDRRGNLHAKILGESTPEVFENIVKELL